MSIRDHIKRQFWKMALTLFVPLAAFELLVNHTPNFSLNSFWVWVVMPSPFILLAFAVWSFYQAAEIICPRCRNGLVFVAAACVAGRHIPCCPNCQISLDAPMSG